MATDEVVFKVTPDGPEWHVEVADKRLLTLLTKETAVAEAQVQALSARPSHLIICGVDGSVEEQTAFPSD